MIIASPARKPLNQKELLKLLGDIGAAHQEHFVILTISGSGQIIARHTIFIGTVDRVMIHPRETFAAALADNAAAFIACHNHPSSDVTPSKQDLASTQTLVAVGQMLNMPLLDHIIVGPGGQYFSFVAEGLLLPGID